MMIDVHGLVQKRIYVLLACVLLLDGDLPSYKDVFVDLDIGTIFSFIVGASLHVERQAA